MLWNVPTFVTGIYTTDSCSFCTCQYSFNVPCTIYHLPFTMYHLPFTIYHVPFTIYHLPCTIYHLPCTIYHLPFTIYHLPFTIYHLPFTIYHLPFTIYHLPPDRLWGETWSWKSSPSPLPWILELFDLRRTSSLGCCCHLSAVRRSQSIQGLDNWRAWFEPRPAFQILV